MKTAVSIPDPLFEAADRLARRRRMSRSALYAEALQMLLAADSSADQITARLDSIYTDHPNAPDPALDAANVGIFQERW